MTVNSNPVTSKKSVFQPNASLGWCTGEILTPVYLITGQELASAFRYCGVTPAFRKFCQGNGIYPVPGRRDFYDPVAVRHMLNQSQGLVALPQGGAVDALARSRDRRDA